MRERGFPLFLKYKLHDCNMKRHRWWLTLKQGLHSDYLDKLEKEQLRESCEVAGIALDPGYHS